MTLMHDYKPLSCLRHPGELSNSEIIFFQIYFESKFLSLFNWCNSMNDRLWYLIYVRCLNTSRDIFPSLCCVTTTRWFWHQHKAIGSALFKSLLIIVYYCPKSPKSELLMIIQNGSRLDHQVLLGCLQQAIIGHHK